LSPDLEREISRLSKEKESIFKLEKLDRSNSNSLIAELEFDYLKVDPMLAILLS